MESEDGYMVPISSATAPVREAEYEARYINVHRVQDAVDKPSTSQAGESGIKQQPSGIYESVKSNAVAETVKQLKEKVENMAKAMEATNKRLEESFHISEHRPHDLFQSHSVKNSTSNLRKFKCIGLAILVFVCIAFAVMSFVIVGMMKQQNDENSRQTAAILNAMRTQIAAFMDKSENIDARVNRSRTVIENNSLAIADFMEKVDTVKDEIMMVDLFANKTMKKLDFHISVTGCASSPCKNGGTCFQISTTYNCTCVSGFVGANCEISLISNGWFQESNYLWYKLFKTRLSHAQSEANCSAAGARLASTGLRNATVISSIKTRLKSSNLETGVWTGLEKVGNKWKWSDGAEAKKPSPGRGWCGMMAKSTGWSLHAAPCATAKHHLCEQ